MISPLKFAFPEDFSDGWHYVDMATDIIFLQDILANFITAFYNRQYVLVVGLGEIAKNYIFGWFIFDLSSGIPFSLFMDENRNDVMVTKLAKAPR